MEKYKHRFSTIATAFKTDIQNEPEIGMRVESNNIMQMWNPESPTYYKLIQVVYSTSS